MNGHRIFDWRFLAVFCVMLLVSVAVYTFVRRVDQTDALVDTARQVARTSERQSIELAGLRQANEQLQADSARRSKAAGRERDQLSRQVTTLQHELVALTAYLRQHNINVPSSVTTPRSGVNRPKAPRTARPSSAAGGPTGTPRATPGHTPATSSPICDLVPKACDPLPLHLPALPVPIL